MPSPAPEVESSHEPPSTHGHAHDTSSVGSTRLVLSIALNLVITAAEVVAGLWAGSLALLADAAHNLNDAASLGISLVARRVSTREADRRRTFGYRRAEVIGAFVNLIALVGIALFLLKEAVERAFDPRVIDGQLMMIVAGVALVANVATAFLLHEGSKDSLNIESAFTHIVADALASVGVIVAGGLVLAFGWTWVDPLLTGALSVYILAQSYGLLRQTVRILMESAPPGFDVAAMVEAMTTHPDVCNVHHVHVWQLDEDRTAAEAHVCIAKRDVDAMEAIKADLKATLCQQFGVEHTTLEFEFEPCADASDDVMRTEAPCGVA